MKINILRRKNVEENTADNVRGIRNNYHLYLMGYYALMADEHKQVVMSGELGMDDKELYKNARKAFAYKAKSLKHLMKIDNYENIMANL